MKKVLACILGILPFVSSPALAYQINLISADNIENPPSFMEALEKYEISTLNKLSSALKDSKIDPASVLTIGINQDGTFSEFKYKSTSSDEAAKKVIQEARSINFGKIPNLKSGTLRFALEYKDLETKEFKRKLYIIKTPEGQTIGGSGGIGIGGIINSEGGKITVTSLEKKGPVPAVPYSDKDRKFDTELSSLYSSLKKYKSISAVDFPDSSFRQRGVPEEQEKITQNEMAEKHWLNAAMSLLHETRLAHNAPEKAIEKLNKSAEVGEKLNAKEKAVFAKALIKLSGDSFSFRGENRFQETIAKTTYKVVTSQNFDDWQTKIQALNYLAQIYSRTNKKAEAISYFKEALAVALNKASYSTDDAVIQYERIAQLQFDQGDALNAKKTISDASHFIEKEYSKNSIRQIPFLVLSIKYDDNEQKKATALAQLEKAVDSYTNNSNAPGGRDKDAALMVRALSGASTGISTRYGKGQISDDMQVNFAKLAYKLQLKANANFDHTTFRNLAKALHNTGRYKQEAELYKNAIAFAESSDDRMTKGYLTSLRKGYASALESAGDTKSAEKEKSDLKLAEEKSSVQFQQRMEDLLADLELKKDSNPLDKAHYRILLLNSYVSKKDTAKTKDTLEKLKQNLESSQEKSHRLLGAGSTLASIVRKHSDFLSSDDNIESLFIKDFLLVDEKSDDRYDSFSIRRLDMMFGRGEESPLSKKLKNALEESRNARGVKSR